MPELSVPLHPPPLPFQIINSGSATHHKGLNEEQIRRNYMRVVRLILKSAKVRPAVAFGPRFALGLSPRSPIQICLEITILGMPGDPPGPNS